MFYLFLGIFHHVSAIIAAGYVCILYYSTSIFKRVGLDHLHSCIATLGLWSLYLTFSLLSMTLVDRLGRKVMLSISHTGMILGMSLFTVFMVLSSDAYDLEWAKYGCAAAIFFYMASYSTGCGSIPWFLPSELFPQEARNAGMTWVSVLCSVGSLTTSFMFPLVVHVMEEYTFLLFVAAVAVPSAWIIWKLPETKGKTIEEIQILLQSRFA